MNFLADKSYLALKPQSVSTTPVIPTHFTPLVSESIRVSPNFTADRRMKGLDWKSDDLLKGSRSIEGDIVIYGDPDNLGHILNMFYAKGSTTGDAANGYTHPFTVGDGKSYCLEISRGEFAQRIYGVRGEDLKLEFDDNKLKATLAIKGLGQFYTASLAIALTGAGMTTAVLSTDYDLRPSDGLVAGDVIRIVETAGTTVDVTLLTVNADGKTVTFASTAITAVVGKAVFLKAQTPSYSALAEPLYFGNTLAGISDTSANADTAAATRATATPCYNLSMEFKNNLLAESASGATGPSVLLNQVKEAAIEVSRLFTDPTQFQKWLENIKQAITVIITGRFIKSDLTTSELLTMKFHKTKLMDNEEPLEVGAYIYDKQKLEALYDSGDAKAIEISLVNRTAGTDY